MSEACRRTTATLLGTTEQKNCPGTIVRIPRGSLLSYEELGADMTEILYKGEDLRVSTADLEARTVEECIPDDTGKPVKATVGICETQPVTITGLRTLVFESEIFQLAWAEQGSQAVVQALDRFSPPDIVILDSAIGIRSITGVLEHIRMRGYRTRGIVWGALLSDSQAMQLLRDGVFGVMKKTVKTEVLMRCLAAVAEGRRWVGEGLAPMHGGQGAPASNLTQRESQVVGLIEQGLRNDEIAAELGISKGTVKIHLKHIFQKRHVNGRLALLAHRLNDHGGCTVQAN